METQTRQSPQDSTPDSARDSARERARISARESARESARLQGLKALVGIMGVLIILGTALVIGVVIHRPYAKPTAPSITSATGSPATETSATGTPPAWSSATAFNRLPAGSHISGLAGAGGDFAVWVTGPGGDSLYLLNPQTGQLRLSLSAPR